MIIALLSIQSTLSSPHIPAVLLLLLLLLVLPPTAGDQMKAKHADALAQLKREVDQRTPKLLRRDAGERGCCIFKVPMSLSTININAYQPLLISVGPYHNAHPSLAMMEEHKWGYLQSLLHRAAPKGISLDTFYHAIAAREPEIRRCYSEKMVFDPQQMVKMMLLDGVFIVELFCKSFNLVAVEESDPLFKMYWVLPFLLRDLIRLENQLPFFVLESIFNLSAPTRNPTPRPLSFASIALHFFNSAALYRPSSLIDTLSNLQGKHLLDLFRSSFIPSSSSRRIHQAGVRKPRAHLVQSATKLRQAGIKLRPRKDAESFLEVRFEGSLLDIPQLTIDDISRTFLLNCVAFEQCYMYCSNHITDYVIFIGCLVYTPQDAEMLCDRKIIENYFGNCEEVAELFNKIGKDVTFDIEKSYLVDIFARVNIRCRKYWSVKWAILTHKYFDPTWSFISVIAAFIILLLTSLQTFYAIYQYYHPLNKAST